MTAIQACTRHLLQLLQARYIHATEIISDYFPPSVEHAE